MSQWPSEAEQPLSEERAPKEESPFEAFLLTWRIPAGVILGFIFLFFIGYDLVLGTYFEVDSDEEAAITLGVVFAQITLLAVWSSLASVSVVARVGSGIGIAALISLVTASSIGRSGNASSSVAWGIGTSVLVMWLTIQIPLWCIRLAGGWRLGFREQVSLEQQSTQYGIRMLLFWTAVVGIWLGIARFLIPSNTGFSANDRELALVLFGVFVAFNSLFALPVVWAALTHRWLVLWIILSLLCYVVLTTAEVYALRFSLGRGGDEEIFWIINALQYVAVVIPLFLVRLCGIRLIRDGGGDSFQLKPTGSPL